MGNEVREAGHRELREAPACHDEDLELDSACSGETSNGF